MNRTVMTTEIHTAATPEFLEYIKAHNITIVHTAHHRQLASDAHNMKKHRRLLKSIIKKALTGK